MLLLPHKYHLWNENYADVIFRLKNNQNSHIARSEIQI